MVTTSSMDLGTLGWVKDEVDETLRQARLALEAFVEHRADEAKLRLCATYLHQVSGTLKMVELDALAQLVGETEAAVQALLQATGVPTEAVLEPLARVLLLLPDLVDRAQAHGAGSGLALVPLANELRVGRGAPPVGLEAYFTVDLSVRPPSSLARDDAGFAEIFRKQRPLFQVALLRWLKEPGGTGEDRTMPDLVRSWRQLIAFAPLSQLLWVAEAFLRRALEQTESNLENKKLVSRLDQLLKRFGDGQDKGSCRTACERLTREMLLALREGASQDEEVIAVRAAFGLEAEELGLSAPSVAALRSMSSALAQEIEHGQALLSRCFDPGKDGAPPSDAELIRLLEKMGKTFGALNIEPLEGLAREAAGVCQSLSEGRLEKSGAVAMAMAQALLQIESAAREIPQGSLSWQVGVEERRRALGDLGGKADVSGMEVSDAPLSEQDRRQLVGAVGGEIRVNLSRIEESFLAFVAAPRDRNGLSGVATLAAQVEAAFRVLEEDGAADLARALYIALDGLASGELTLQGEAPEALAAAVAGLEAQVTGLERGRPLLASQLAALASALGGFSRATEQTAVPLSDQSVPEAPLLSHLVPGLAVAPSHPPIDPEILPVFLEDAHQAVAQLEEALPAWKVQLADENAIGLARRAFHTLKGSGRMVEAGEIAELAYDAETYLNKVRGRQLVAGVQGFEWISRASQAVSDWIRALEQGYELPEMASLRVALQALAEGCDADEVEVRVSALRAPTPNLLDESFVLQDRPALEEAPCGDYVGVPAAELLAEEEQAMAPFDALFASPEEPVVPEAAAESSLVSGQPIMSSPPPQSVYSDVESWVGSPLANDHLLRDIFITETQDHLVALKAALEAGSEQAVSAQLLRAAHTMQGSARSVGLLSMAEACAGIERYFQTRELLQKTVGAEGMDLLSALAAATESFLSSFQDGRDPTPIFEALSLRLNGLFEEILPAPGLTWWQKNLELQEGAGETTAHDADAVLIEPPGVSDLASEELSLSESHLSSGEEAPFASSPTDEVDPELRDIFRDEARDLLDAFEGALAEWRSRRHDPAPLQSLKRVLHTLKGGARMCGAVRMGDFAHITEELLRGVEEGSYPCDDALFGLMDLAAEHLGVLYKSFVSGRLLVETDADRALWARLRGEKAGDPLQGLEDVLASPVVSEEPKATAAPEDEADLFRPEAATQVRVRTALLDRLVNYAGEVSIARSRMEQQVFSLREHLSELNGNVKRFREQVRELEIQAESQIVFRAQLGEGHAPEDFDPLEFDRFSRLQQLSRGLTENLHDLITLHGTLDTVASQAEAVLQQQARVNTELQEGLMRTRMVSFATQAHRLRQIIRQTSRELNKQTELIVTGADVELDRHLLERMIGPFEHMIRNAIDHGLEAAAERIRLGKPATGTVRIHALHESGEIVIRISDDGAGLNIERIRAKAVERKLVPATAVLTDEQVMQFILLPGFSTAAQVTHVSGRGVGMDVVHSEVKKLGGAITVDTKAGRGTTFVIRLPLTLSITQALMVTCGDQVFAIPLAAIVNIVEAPGAAIADALLQKRPTLRYGGKDYAFMDLGRRLGVPRVGDMPRKLPVLLLRLDAREVAVTVDGLLGTREVVVKSLGPQLAEVRGLFGATIMGDGRVLLILDIPALWMEDEGLRVQAIVAEAPAVTRPYVLVVDDSLTVRKVTTRFLQKQGYDAATAKDGIEALEQLRERIPDVMLVDIEMPRMDGYELTARIRDDVRLRDVPIIMITSRSGHKHRERAMSLGVDVYLGKPYQEEDLRKEIEALMRRGHS